MSHPIPFTTSVENTSKFAGPGWEFIFAATTRDYCETRLIIKTWVHDGLPMYIRVNYITRIHWFSSSAYYTGDLRLVNVTLYLLLVVAARTSYYKSFTIIRARACMRLHVLPATKFNRATSYLRAVRNLRLAAWIAVTGVSNQIARRNVFLQRCRFARLKSIVTNRARCRVELERGLCIINLANVVSARLTNLCTLWRVLYFYKYIASFCTFWPRLRSLYAFSIIFTNCALETVQAPDDSVNPLIITRSSRPKESWDNKKFTSSPRKFL